MDEDGIDEVVEAMRERMTRHSALLDLLRAGYLDEEVLSLFYTGNEGWRLVSFDLN